MIVPLFINGLSLLAVHGVCCLGLRHPDYTGPSRKLVLEFVKAAEDKLLEIGAITEEDIKEIHQVERDESPHKDL